MNIKLNLKVKLNLGYVDVLENVMCDSGGFPYVGLHETPHIDYIALYSDLAEYHKTPNTCVSFYEYDDIIDGKDGLWNCIVRADGPRLEKFKKRFERVPYIIEPDYTVAGDLPPECNAFAVFKARVVGAWLSLNTRAQIIPNIQYVGKTSLSYCFRGIKNGSFVAYSAKGNFRTPDGMSFIEESINATVDAINPQGIIIFTTSPLLSNNNHIFSHARDRGVEILMPDTRAKIRNCILLEKRRATNGKI